jgi:hypothetical protein
MRNIESAAASERWYCVTAIMNSLYVSLGYKDCFSSVLLFKSSYAFDNSIP